MSGMVTCVWIGEDATRWAQAPYWRECTVQLCQYIDIQPLISPLTGSCWGHYACW